MFFSHLFLIIFFHLFSERNCQNTKTFELKLNQTITNINEELGVSYFNLTIDANEYNYDLMITVKPLRQTHILQSLLINGNLLL